MLSGMKHLKKSTEKLQTEYIVKRMRKESGFDNMKVVATGGLGKMIYENTDCIDTYDPDLTLYGLRIIMDKQKQA